MPNNEMDYSLIHRTPDGNGKILVTTPGSPDKGSWETEAELKTYVNQDVVMKTDIVQTLGQQTDKVPSNKAVDDAINAINSRVTNIEDTLIGENEITVQYPSDSTYSSLMPNKVPLRALKFAEVPRFRGKSRAWNQILPPSAQGSTVVNDVTIASDGNGAYTLNGTASSYIYTTIKTSFQNDMVVGHKYLIFCNSPSGNVYLADSYSNKFDVNSAAIFDYTTAVTIWIGLHVRGGATVNETVKPMVRDLTLIFGSGNEPSTVADALAQLPALGQYNAYDAGSLVDTVVSGVKSVGVNIWDEEWEVGSLNLSTGANNDSVSNEIRSKNYIPLNYGKEYYVLSPTPATGLYACIYDENKNFLSARLFNNANGLTITPTAEQKYMRFYTAYDATSYSGGIQICLNSYADKTTYHPYKTDTLSLPSPVTLRSAGAVSEVLTLETGKKTRPIGSVDMGTLEWIGSNGEFYVLNVDGWIEFPEENTEAGNVLCPKYVTTSYVEATEKTIFTTWKSAGVKGLFVRDSSYSDVATFKTAMSGVYLYYELATPDPDEQVCDPIPYNFLEVEGGGTIETIQTQTPVIDNCLDVTYDIIPQ